MEGRLWSQGMYPITLVLQIIDLKSLTVISFSLFVYRPAPMKSCLKRIRTIFDWLRRRKQSRRQTRQRPLLPARANMVVNLKVPWENHYTTTAYTL